MKPISQRSATLAVAMLAAVAGIAYGAVASTGASSGKPTDYSLRTVNTSAGRMVVTGGGVTVYVYLPDPTRPSRTTCTADCANDWPPVLLTAATPKVSGVDRSRVGVVVRPDGSRQLTLNGYPLYLYVADRRPGDLRGESVGETWFAVDADGNFLPLPPEVFSPGREPVSALPVEIVPSALGQIVAGNDGQTLYTYRDDTPAGSACTSAWCVQDWPAVVVVKQPAGVIQGVSAPFGVLRRDDGSLQLTLGGHPLYRFSGDQRPGDLRGSGVGGDWYPIHPDGTRAGG
ncbi:MAG TPA: hypothetical protein VFV02_09230 [Acidimicrobiales bacterium]|nr:hypothetical protein [Acidimicrobiales bacterium]